MSDSTYIEKSFGKKSGSNGTAVEIRIFWGGELLDRFELPPPRSFVLGDASESKTPVDFTIPDAATVLGSTASALVRTDGGIAKVIVPEGAKAVWRNERPRFGEPPSAPITEREIVLGERAVDVHVSGLVFSMKMTEREAKCPRSPLAGTDRRILAFFGLSLVSSAALVGSLMMALPGYGLADDEDVDRDRMIAMMQYLDASAERDRELDVTPPTDPGAGGPGGEPAKGAAGTMGKPEVAQKVRHASGRDPGADLRPATSRDEQIAEAAHFGMIGQLSSSLAAPTIAPWDDNGVGPQAFAGGFFGEIGDQNGSGGLTLSGLDNGGGGRGDQISMGGIGVCPNGFCSGLGPDGHFGRSGALTRRDHAQKPFTIRPAGNSIVSGHLPPEVIQRVVRQSFGRFRGCYEDGLRANPNLEGRVTARFVIARDGSVASVQSGGSDLPDAKVVACVLRNYQALSFPAPGDGVVTVSYPLMFSPSA